MMYLLLIVGFILLIKGADFFVDGSSSLAGILKIPSVIIGLTIVSMGTSAPEAAVSITAGLAGNSDISLGNILGSNIFNLVAVIGICALIFGVVSPKEIIRRDMWWNIAVSALLLLFIADGKIQRYEGILLLCGMVLYLFVVVKSALKNKTESEPTKIMSVPKSLLFIAAGLAAIILGGNLVVNNAKLIAAAWGMSDTLIALTIVAIGTSLPELVTSLTAAKKGDSGIALGNAVGSCIFNIFFILGIASTLAPITVEKDLIIDTFILIGICIMMTIFAMTNKKTGHIEGLVCVLCYVAYSAFIIMR